MTEKEKSELLLDAVRDIQKVLGSMVQLGSIPKDQAIKVFSDSFEVIANICIEAEKRVTLQ